MRYIIDTDNQTLTELDGGQEGVVRELFSPEAFRLLTDLFVKYGWANKYTYDFLWMGRRVIQLPDDLVRLQELIWETRPTLIIETGIAHGGSTVFFASLMELMGEGRVVSVDIDIRAHNRAALEEHPLRSRYTLLEGSSVDPAVVERVRGLIRDDDRVMVMLDSNHSAEHVLAELHAYAPLVTSGCYCVVADGIMPIVHDVPGGAPEWTDDNPISAVRAFLAEHPEFEPDPRFTRTGVTYFQEGYLRRN